MLRARQLETLANLKKHNKCKTPEDVIEYCKKQLSKPYGPFDYIEHKERFEKRPPKSLTRKRKKRYYQEIIDFLETSNKDS